MLGLGLIWCNGMTLKQLKAFLAVAQTLNFAAASELVFLSRPALSLAIKELEASLGGALFTRSTRKVALTPEGKLFLPMARRIVVDMENAEDTMRHYFTLKSGKVGIAAMPSVSATLLPGMLVAFQRRYPDVHVAVHDVINEQVLDRVRSHEVEVGLCFAPEFLGELAFTPLYQDRFVAVVPGQSELAGASSLTWAQLRRYPFVALQRPSVVRSLIEQQLALTHQRLEVAFESHQLSTLGKMVASGLGVSIVPSICIDDMQALGCCCLALDEPQIARGIGIVTLADTSLSAAATALVETIRQFDITQTEG